MYHVGRALQVVGLVVTGIAFFDGAVGGHVRRELVLLVVGAAIFSFGRWLQARNGGP